PTLDGQPFPMWEGVAVREGQVLALGAARAGARAYIAVAGGVDTKPVLGSRATFHMAGVGGMGGYALQAGQVVPVATAEASSGRRIAASFRPPIGNQREWAVEVVRGPNDDWIDAAGHEAFLSSPWKLQAKSNRTGFR